MTIRIKDLRLRAVIGLNEWEREIEQDLIINIEMEFDGAKAAQTDDIQDTVDYKAMKRRIKEEVEHSQYHLLEALASHILEIVMGEKKVARATVEVDKPHALRFADSVSVRCSAERGE